MTQSSKSMGGLPASLSNQILQVGQNIRLARKKRGLTMADMAERMFITRKTLSRLENGESSISIGVLASALLVLGLENDLDKLADPSSDQAGNILDKEKFAQMKRVRPKKPVDMDF